MVDITQLTQLTPHDLIYQFFLPFILTYTIFFAVLQLLPLFSKRINLIISLVITILIAVSPMWVKIVTIMTQYGVFSAVGAFFAVFVVGVWAWAFRKSREYATGTPDDIRRLEKDIRNKKKKLDRESDERKKMRLRRELYELEKDLDIALGRR
jgi:hypothetical protein